MEASRPGFHRSRRAGGFEFTEFSINASLMLPTNGGYIGPQLCNPTAVAASKSRLRRAARKASEK